MVDIIDKALRMGEGHQLKKLENVAKAVNALEDEISALSDEDLKAQTPKFKQEIENGKSLDEIMPEAFATVREVSKRTLGQRHFDVQLMGGAALHWGNIAEMKTGEGKTLVATLPTYLNALEGKGVHVVTVNDYLARRDAGWMGQIPCLILLLIPFLVSKGATIVVTVVILLRFVQIYMLTAFNPLPIAFIAQEETRQWGVNYFKQYASLVFQCATLYLAILMYRTLVGGTLNPSKFKDGDSLSGWVMGNFTGLLLASVMLIGVVMAANSVAKKLFGGE